MAVKLPAPVCHLGYPQWQVEDILGDRIMEFWEWMRGQTSSLCEGREYDYELKEYQPTNCGPHGLVVYSWDVRNFFDSNLPWD